MKGKLTPHQREVLGRIISIYVRWGSSHGVWEGYVGSKGACAKLVEKGWLTVEHQRPTGRRRKVQAYYRPTS